MEILINIIKLDEEEINLLRNILFERLKILGEYCLNNEDPEEALCVEHVKGIKLAAKLEQMVLENSLNEFH